MNEQYQPHILEKDAQHFWEKNARFQVTEDPTRQKFYCLSMFPYPSGRIHMGHVRNYTLGDVIARFQRMQGKNVLQPMGWDAFGLPAENAAIKNNIPPAQWTYDNIKSMREQLKALGFAYDWTREITTCRPEYYRFEQLLFVRLFKKGLVYQKNAWVNWDPVDQTVLANEQVVNGRGWRSDALIERKQIPQWFLRITAYADELLKGLDALAWPEQVKTMQKHWIGRSEGAEVKFNVIGTDTTLEIFTTRVDTLMGATYLGLAPEHPLIHDLLPDNPALAAFVEECRHLKTAEADMATLPKKGVATTLFAEHPITKEKLPIWAANFVVMDYGTGAVMAVPAHDERDFEFAHLYGLPIKPVITPENTATTLPTSAWIGPGRLIDSGEFSTLQSEDAKKIITQALVDRGLGQADIQYRLRDWGISRQRYWGAPIPIIYCQHCGTQPVPEDQLPVVLPEDVVFKGVGSPLKEMPSFYETTCPVCQNPARRETDTFDTFIESSWYYARFACPDAKDILDARAYYWTPVDQYIGGIEHAILHLLYARFFHKVLRDEGWLDSDEPFTRLLTQGMVLKDGFKMSKSKGNIVEPATLINTYGADTMRLFMMFASPPELSLEWSDAGVEGAHRFLKRLWRFAYQVMQLTPPAQNVMTAEQQTLRRLTHQTLQKITDDYSRRLSFNTAIASTMELLNAANELDNKSSHNQPILREVLELLVIMLSPIVPHITHTLWQALGSTTPLIDVSWPTPDKNALIEEIVELVVQVNGKKRGSVRVNADADQKIVVAACQQDEKLQGYFAEGTIQKIVLVPKKLINFVVT